MDGRNALKATLGATAMLAAALLCYRGLVFAPANAPIYPWASDTFGHVMKVEYLLDEVSAGHPVPTLFPQWYMGLQILRYYPPLPYLVLMGLTAVIGDAVAAANSYIVLCALAGGLSLLLYRRWLGWMPAIAAGIVYMVLPDFLRVALAEGNLPRVLTAALLPLTLYCLLRSLEEGHVTSFHIGLTLCFAAITLSHAMVAAIYATCCLTLAAILWAWRVTRMRQVVFAGLSVALGLMASAWWLLPSLTGGITELNSAAMTEALAVFPLTTYLNPTLRLQNPEIVYPGAALVVIAALLLALPRRRDGWSIGLTLVGLLGVLISTPGFNTLFNALPAHHLLWPIRFLQFATFALLLAIAWRAKDVAGRLILPALLIFGLLLADSAGSLHLAHGRAPRSDIVVTAERLRALSGWREATLDYSRLGSAPTYFYSAVSDREQLYGWAYQGARAATNVASINEAMERGYAGYLTDRLTLYGVDDIVWLRDDVNSLGLPELVQRAGFATEYEGNDVVLYHRDGVPRAYRADWTALGIGRSAQNLSFIFPEIIQGSRRQIDEYTFEELSAFETLVLSGFEWNSREAAEELVCRLADNGVRVLVDLTGTPLDPMAREPRFLDVWGEYISLDRHAVTLHGEGEDLLLRPFSAEFPYWQTHTPQGLDEIVLRQDYLGGESAVTGSRQCGSGRVGFIGLNLPYHAALTQDPAAIAILEDMLGMPAGSPHQYTSIPLQNYMPTYDGYDFSYALDQDDTLVVPVAHHEGTVVEVDGAPTRVTSFENLVSFDAPAGTHAVRIRVAPTPIYGWGKLVTGLAVVALLGMTWAGRRWRRSQGTGEV